MQDRVHEREGIIVTLDRKSRFLEARKTRSRKKAEMGQRLVIMLNGHPSKPLSVDNGREFYDHKDITDQSAAAIYVADPYASWQRGSNKNPRSLPHDALCFGLLRRYSPKGTDFNKISPQVLRHMVEKINLMPRKLLK